MPHWAEFDPATGRLWGRPVAADVGTFRNIRIRVSDGRHTAVFEAFDFSVNRSRPGAATLPLNPSTENANGSSLGDLAGYRISYGKSPSLLRTSITIDNPGLTRYVIENLSLAKWYFAMTPVNSNGVESRRSKVVSKRVS